MAALIRHSCARSSCEKGPQAGCKLYDMMEQTGAKTQAFCHDQTQPLQGLGRDDRLHRKGNARQQSLQPLGNMQSSRDGLKHGNNRGVALLTLITQMFKVPARISADAELRQQHGGHAAVPVLWSGPRALMKHYFITPCFWHLLAGCETTRCVASRRTQDCVLTPEGVF